MGNISLFGEVCMKRLRGIEWRRRISLRACSEQHNWASLLMRMEANFKSLKENFGCRKIAQ